MSKEINGECFCGKITYKINGSLHSAQSCHCSRCRKAFSSQASAVAFLNDSEFEWLTGDELLTSYVNKESLGIQFCKVCGSTLSIIHKDTVVGITLGCINGDPKVEITRHLYVGSKAPWEKLPENIITFEEGPTTN